MQESTISIFPRKESKDVVTPISSVHWFHSRNQRTDYQDAENLIPLLVPGWYSIEPVLCRKISKEDADLAVTERESTLRELQSDPKFAERHQAFARIFTDKKTGKVVKPEYEAIACYRRGSVLLDAQIKRFQQSMDADTLPCKVFEFANETELLGIHLLENRKAEGFREMTGPEKLRAAKRLFELGAIENDLRKVFKDGTGQKLYAILKADNRFPEAKLVDRIMLPAKVMVGNVEIDNPDYVPFGSIGIKKLREIGDLSKSPTANTDMLKAYIQDVVNGVANATKSMSGDDIEVLGNQNPIELVKVVCKVIRERQNMLLVSHNSAAEAYNAVTTLLVNPEKLAKAVTYLKELTK